MTQGMIFETEVTVDEHGDVHIAFPPHLPPGSRVQVRVQPPLEASEEMTDEEADAILAEPWVFKARTAGEIAASGVIGSWANKGITDSVAFLEAQRRKRREHLFNSEADVE